MSDRIDFLKLAWPGLLAVLLLAAAPGAAQAQEHMCTDGQRSYFGVCPDGKAVPYTPPPSAPAPHEMTAEEAEAAGLSAYKAAHYAEALPLFQRAADQGNATAVFWLGIMHSNGQGMATDLAEAQRLYLKSSAMGEMNATFVAGSYYVNGKGVAQDCAEGKRLLFIAIAAKASNAMRFLGSMYDNGVCVQQDKVTAQLWYDKATATP